MLEGIGAIEFTGPYCCRNHPKWEDNKTMRHFMHIALRKNKLTILSLYKYKLSLTWKEITFKSSAGSRKMHDKSITALLLQKECSIWTYTP
jgi:hypothetical protein